MSWYPYDIAVHNEQSARRLLQVLGQRERAGGPLAILGGSPPVYGISAPNHGLQSHMSGMMPGVTLRRDRTAPDALQAHATRYSLHAPETMQQQVQLRPASAVQRHYARVPCAHER